MLAKDLGPLAKSTTSSEVRAWAARLRADYTYPVDSIIYEPGGQKLLNVAANDLTGNKIKGYTKFLHEGLKAWQASEDE